MAAVRKHDEKHSGGLLMQIEKGIKRCQLAASLICCNALQKNQINATYRMELEDMAQPDQSGPREVIGEKKGVNPPETLHGKSTTAILLCSVIQSQQPL